MPRNRILSAIVILLAASFIAGGNARWIAKTVGEIARLCDATAFASAFDGSRETGSDSSGDQTPDDPANSEPEETPDASFDDLLCPFTHSVEAIGLDRSAYQPSGPPLLYSMQADCSLFRPPCA